MSNSPLVITRITKNSVEGSSEITGVSGRVEFIPPNVDFSNYSPEQIFAYGVLYAVIANCGNPMPNPPEIPELSPVGERSHTTII